MSPESSDLHKLVGEIFLQVAALRSEVQALHSKLDSKIQPEGWTSPSEAAATLKNEGIKSSSHLKRLRLEGVFSEARGEIRDVGNGDRPTWQYHTGKCKRALQRHFKRLGAS